MAFRGLIGASSGSRKWTVLKGISLAKLAIVALFLFVPVCPVLPHRLAQAPPSQRQIVTIRIEAASPRAHIEIAGTSSRQWSFRNEYAGVLELAQRIEGFKAFDSTGAEVQVQRLAPGQFSATTDAVKVNYEVKLAPPSRAADAARVSWISGGQGLLMLADLLPVSEFAGGGADPQQLSTDRLVVQLDLPNGWQAYSSGSQGAAMELKASNTERQVIEIGTHLRRTESSVSGTKLMLFTDEDWQFAEAQAQELAKDVLTAYRKVLGSMPAERVSLTLLSLPMSGPANKWSAETRGTSVTILLGKQPSKSAALAQLTAPLTHELFHLWVPNGLALSGDYDWFYEGFTVYQATRIDVRLGFLTFQDFLNTIAGAYDAYRVMPERDQSSLIEASQRRWTGGEPAVYTKGMLVAFLYDLNLRKASGRKRSVDDVYRSIFERFGIKAAQVPEQTDGTRVVISALDEQLRGFADLYITRPATIDLGVLLSQFGFQVEKFGARTRITVSETLTHQQRDLLRDLGYNNAGRASRRKLAASNRQFRFDDTHERFAPFSAQQTDLVCIDNALSRMQHAG